LVPLDAVRAAARLLAGEIAASGPLAIRSIRQTMRGHLAADVAKATDREDAEQIRLRTTSDFAEGIRATAERRPPQFTGR
jgi:2-(1,2-epoxy-1,2-dihydrophenyl)acetyl-CoA isomerase